LYFLHICALLCSNRSSPLRNRSLIVEKDDAKLRPAKMAMLYVLAEHAPECHSATVAKAEVRDYDARMAEHSNDQLYASSEESLLQFAKS